MSRSPSSSSSSCSSSGDDNNPASAEEQQREYRQRSSKYAGMSIQEFWAAKKQERKERVKQRRRAARAENQKNWVKLSDEEKKQLRHAAILKHQQRNRDKEAHEALCRKNMGIVSNTGTNDDDGDEGCRAATTAPARIPTLVFDLQFGVTMIPRDVKSTTSQLKIAYSDLKKAAFILRPALYSGGNQQQQQQQKQDGSKDDSAQQAQQPTEEEEEVLSKERGDHIFPLLKQYPGFKHYPPAMVDASVASLPRETTVYLTADSDSVLWELSPDETYVIGAFVDHNRNKGATVNFAQKHGMRTARFPVNESIPLDHRCKVLTVNHVVQVLLAVFAAQNNNNSNFQEEKKQVWAKALLATMPTRTENKLGKNNNSNSNNNKQDSAAAAAAAAGEKDESVPSRRSRNGDDGGGENQS